MLQIPQLLLIGLLSTGPAEANTGLNPAPDDCHREHYGYYLKNGEFYGAPDCMANEDQHYPSPTGEIMYYCVSPEHDRGRHKYANECCSAVLDKIREFFVCTSRDCEDGAFWYMNEEGKVVGKSLTSDPDRVEPHRQFESGLTSFRVCSE
jgi:hypothetical protein